VAAKRLIAWVADRPFGRLVPVCRQS